MRVIPRGVWRAHSPGGPLRSRNARYCAAHPASLVAYLHDKGTRRSSSNVEVFARQWDWRRLHEYFLVEVPQGCVTAMDAGGYQLCGVNRVHSPSLHYSGNFWWARCDYVSTLVHPAEYTDPELDPFLYPEMWVGSGGGRAFNCFTSHTHHFTFEYSRAVYAGATCDEDV